MSNTGNELQTDRQTVGGKASGDADCRAPGWCDQARSHHPSEIVGHRHPIDLGWELGFDWERWDLGCRQGKNVVLIEERAHHPMKVSPATLSQEDVLGRESAPELDVLSNGTLEQWILIVGNWPSVAGISQAPQHPEDRLGVFHVGVVYRKRTTHRFDTSSC